MLTQLEIRDEYLPHSDAPPEQFYRTVIKHSVYYSRAAGYFSSGILKLFTIEFLDFALRGGRIDLICSNELANEDIETIHENKPLGDIDRNLLHQISLLENDNSKIDALAFFATLLKNGILNIKIAKYKTGGIFHDKTGCFFDKIGNSVSFRGSPNETYMGWSVYGNFETLEAFCSWKSKDKGRVQNHKTYLEKIWANELPGLEVSDLSDLSKGELLRRARADIDDFRPILEKLEENEKTNRLSQDTSNKRTLMPFQRDTLDNWKNSSFRGIIKHATGSGKTVTAIDALHTHISDGLAAIVAVPSALLLKQWREEILKDIPDATIMLCGDGNIGWKKPSRLRNLLTKNQNGKGAVILTILDTMVSPTFFRNLTDLEEVLLISDEAHSLGSTQNAAILDLNFGLRLGLSATPERFRDTEGTDKIFHFFSQILDPVISIADAIDKGRLVNYVYNPQIVKLDETEMAEWRRITQLMIRASSNKNSDKKGGSTDRLKMLSIQRSRVAKKAASKVPVAASVILKNYRDGEYWLIYCEDTDQLEEMNGVLRREGISPHIYKSNMAGSKEAELEDYILFGGIMLSIKCLDEGVDIPKISHAVIMASSQNPRQFIQRRGRVLRKDNQKSKAVIYDLFAVPNSEESIMPDSLLKSELSRAIEFADSALNTNGAMSTLRLIFLKLNLQLEDFSDYNQNEPDDELLNFEEV